MASKRFVTVYEKPRTLFGLFPSWKWAATEFIEAENVSQAQTIADERAKQHGWRVDAIKEESIIKTGIAHGHRFIEKEVKP